MDMTRHRTAPYLLFAALFAASGVVYYILPHGDLIQQIAAVPLVGSLIGLLVKILLDEAAHQRDLLRVAAQNHFALAATSHMAGAAFDKHVMFSEAYAAELDAALGTLFRKGPTDEVLTHANELHGLRRQYAVWLTKRIETQLELFESALRSVGANAGYVYANDGAEDRQTKLEAMYRTFAELVNFGEWGGEKLTGERAVTTMIQHLRTILGTEVLTGLRISIMANAERQLAIKP